MQLRTAIHTNETGNVLASGTMGIAQNPKMFRILSDSMYKNKIGSMVRETYSNARDAHVDAGKPDVAPHIHLPTAFEPWYSVQDFGTGISPDDIENVFCIYGVSTKDQSNDAIGAFGLGAKTPLAYTDNFTVISIVDGVIRTYTIGYGPDGSPTYALQSESETDEGNGFTIMVTVDEGDFEKFASAVKSQLRFFPVKPEIVNEDIDIEWDDLSEGITYESDLVTMYKSGYNNAPFRGLYVIQGGVGYPVDIAELDGIEGVTASFAKALQDNNSFMVFEIGEIDVTAPREGISYDAQTIKNIGDRIAKIAEVMARDVMAQVQKEKSIWNRAVIYNNQISVVQKAIKQSPLFDKLFEGMQVDRHGKLAVNMDDLVALGMNAIQLGQFGKRGGVAIQRRTLGNMSQYGNEYLTAAQSIHVYLRDSKSKPIARIKSFIEDNDYPVTVMIENKHDVVVDAGMKAKIAKALRMPVEQIKLISDLPMPATPARGTRASGAAPKAFQWSEGKSTGYSTYWERLYDHIDDIGAAVYVTMHRHDVHFDDNVRLIFSAAEAGELPYEIIAVNESTAKRIKDGKVGAELLSPEQVADEVREKMAGVKQIFVKYAREAAFINQLNHNSALMTLLEEGMFENLKKQVDNIVEKRSWMAEVVERHKWMRNAFYSATEASAEKGKARGQSIIEGFEADFPMLRYVEGRFGAKLEDTVLADVLVYVQQVENNQAGVDAPA